MANRICEALAQPYKIEGKCIAIGASIGVALGHKDAQAATELLKAADLALYAGGGTWVGLRSRAEGVPTAGAFVLDLSDICRS